MGCLFQCLDPSPPDESVRCFWHIRGVIVDSVSTGAAPSASSAARQHHSPSADTLQVDNISATANGQQQQQRRGKNSEEDGKRPMGTVMAKDKVQRLPAGVLYIFEGRLVYRGRRWARWCLWHRRRRELDTLEVELCEIVDVNVVDQFVSQRDNKPLRCAGPLVDVKIVARPSASSASPSASPSGTRCSLHLGILTDSADLVGKELRETFQRHRQRPRIFQFNSVDIEGVEIDVP